MERIPPLLRPVDNTIPSISPVSHSLISSGLNRSNAPVLPFFLAKANASRFRRSGHPFTRAIMPLIISHVASAKRELLESPLLLRRVRFVFVLPETLLKESLPHPPRSPGIPRQRQRSPSHRPQLQIVPPVCVRFPTLIVRPRNDVQPVLFEIQPAAKDEMLPRRTPSQSQPRR